jgi:hypothetical protein
VRLGKGCDQVRGGAEEHPVARVEVGYLTQ